MPESNPSPAKNRLSQDKPFKIQSACRFDIAQRTEGQCHRIKARRTPLVTFGGP